MIGGDSFTKQFMATHQPRTTNSMEQILKRMRKIHVSSDHERGNVGNVSKKNYVAFL